MAILRDPNYDYSAISERTVHKFAPIKYAVVVKASDGGIPVFHAPNSELSVQADGDNIRVLAYDARNESDKVMAVFCNPIYAKLVEEGTSETRS